MERPREGGSLLKSNFFNLSEFFSFILLWKWVTFFFCGMMEQDSFYFPYHTISGSFVLLSSTSKRESTMSLKLISINMFSFCFLLVRKKKKCEVWNLEFTMAH